MNKRTKSNLLKAICLLLLAANFLVGCKKQEEEYLENRLTVEVTKVEYTDAEKGKITEKLSDLAIKIAEKITGITLTDKKKDDIKSSINTEIVPILESNSLNFETLKTTYQKFIREKENGFEKSSAFEIYQFLAANAGAEKTSGVLFDLVNLRIKNLERESVERYEKYGFTWYKEKADKLKNMLDESKKILNKKKFSEISNLYLFVFSFVLGTETQDKNQTDLISDEEKMLILKRQADIFSQYEVSEEQWELSSEMVLNSIPEELLYPKDLHGFIKQELRYLTESGYIGRVFSTLKPLVNLYCKLVYTMEAEDLQAKDQREILSVFAKSLKENEREFSIYLDAFEKSAKSDSEKEKSELEMSKETAEFEAFKLTIDINTTRIDFIKSVYALEDKTDESYNNFIATAKSYFFKIAPYVTYSLEKLMNERQ